MNDATRKSGEKKLLELKTFFIDHFNILFKSAAVNHIRIERILKQKDGSYQLTVKFGSYSELKRYQKGLRRCTVSFSGAVILIIAAFFAGYYF